VPPPAPLPFHPATFTHIPYTQQAQSFFQNPTSNLNQQAFNPSYPNHWQPPQWNIPYAVSQVFSFTNPNLQKNNITKGKPIRHAMLLKSQSLAKFKVKSSSRQIAQRRNTINSNLASKKLHTEQQQKLKRALHITRYRCLHQYGFFAVPKYSP
jgi:hypothetical protein